MASTQPYKDLPFPPVTKQHIFNCSFNSWYPRYRRITPKTRLVRLSSSFLEYLEADGILLPPEGSKSLNSDVAVDSATADDSWTDGDPPESDDPSSAWPSIHEEIISTIKELGGSVTPKLNWSAPKDATWINPTNTMECRSANDVYMMLKSSDFITHDLEHAFDGCDDASAEQHGGQEIDYHLVLRKWVSAWNPSVEFRCFVRKRTLLGICQRDLNHYDFLFGLRSTILNLVSDFFNKEMKSSFPDENFVFDVYVPQPYNRVWLVDINPWAIRTDPILYSWKELLEMDDPTDSVSEVTDLNGGADLPEGNVIRLSLQSHTVDAASNEPRPTALPTPSDSGSSSASDSEQSISDSNLLELRLIRRSDPEGYTFNTPQYSAHKLPREVVDASSGAYDSEQLKDFADKWKELVEQGDQDNRVN